MAKKGKKGTHFVPIEDAPTGGLSDRARELVALALCGFSMYALLCLATFRAPTIARAGDIEPTIPFHGIYNLGGTFGYYLASGFTYTLGLAGWVPFLALLGYGVALFLHKRIERLQIKALGTVVFAAMLSLLLANPDPVAFDGMTALAPEGAGGRFGAVLSPRLHHVFGGPGRILLLLFGAIVSLLLMTEWMFSHMLERAAVAIAGLWQRIARRPAWAAAGGALVDEDEVDGKPQPRRRARKASKPRKPRGEADGEDAGAASARSDEFAAEVTERAALTDDADEEADGDDAADDAADAVVAPARGRRRGSRRDEPEEVGIDEVAELVGEEGAGVAVAARGEDEDEDEDDGDGDAADEAEAEVAAPPPPPRKPIPRRKPKPRRRQQQSQLPFDSEYPFPPVDLFAEPEHLDMSEASGELERGGDAIVAKLASFGIETEVVAASIGPAVTQFELRLAEGIRVGRIGGFEADLAAALKAVSVRVVAPIPGKDTVGIEVPNPERQKVPFRDLLDQFGRAEDLAIPLFLGKDVAGDPIVEDMARMPHLLIAGTTGSGKSVCINAILLSILMTRTPRQVKLILVDPKMVELQAYRNAPHLCCDVVTNMKKAPAVLQWAVDEMENRYALLSSVGVNHIKSYNRLGQQEVSKRLGREVEPERIYLPYIVLVIDEFADLMNVAAKEVEESIQRLAQKSRAVGMHVIVATQRPSSDVITGIIKANLPTQIAFKVNRRIDSRVILDSNGAEKLLGHGDMLYVPPGGGTMTRAQGAFVSEEEMHAVVKFLEEKGARPNFLSALVQTQSSSRQGMATRDDLYREAAEVILGQQRGSATLLQRALSVGYTRATRLLEMMEEDGLVGPFVGSKSRDVLMTLEEWKEREAAAAAELAALDAEGEEYEDGDYEDAGVDAELVDDAAAELDEDAAEADEEADEVDEDSADESEVEAVDEVVARRQARSAGSEGDVDDPEAVDDDREQ